MNGSSQVTLGCVEIVDFPLLNVRKVYAKIDTGAFSGAINCEDVQVATTTDGMQVLRFLPLGSASHVPFETTQFKKIFVRSSHGHRLYRYVVDTEVTIQNATYPVRIGLSNRADMKFPVLIGRRFIRENNMVVDVSKNAELDEEGSYLT